MEYISENPEQTAEFISTLVSRLSGGDLLCLSGELGSGKTTSVKSIARALGIEQEVTSPTFVIMKNYLLAIPVRGIKEVVHLDAYRLHAAPDSESIGLSEYLSRDDVLTIIEWPENIANAIPRNCKRIFFEHLEDDKRKITTSF